MEVEQAVFIVALDKNQFIIKSWCFEWKNVYNLLFFSTFPCGEGGVWLHDKYVNDFFFCIDPAGCAEEDKRCVCIKTALSWRHTGDRDVSVQK